MRKLLLLPVLFLMTLTSCSTKTHLSYHPVMTKADSNQIALKVEPMEDQREKPQQIGAFKNGLGITLVKIMTEDSVPDWVSNAFKAELTRAGYSLVESAADSQYVVEGKIINAYASSYFTYDGKMTLELSLKKGEEVILHKIYKAKESAGINWMGQSSMCVEALSYSLQEICKAFIEDVNKLVL